MVFQVANEEEKKEEVEYAVPLPIPGNTPVVEQINGTRSFIRKRRTTKGLVIFSFALNVAFIIAIVTLVCHYHTLQKKVNRLESRVSELRDENEELKQEAQEEEVELEPIQVVDDENEISLKANVNTIGHQMIKMLELTYGMTEWYKKGHGCRFYMRFTVITANYNNTGYN